MFPNKFLMIYCVSGPVWYGHDATVTVTLNVCFYPATMWVLPDIAHILAI